MFIVSGTGRRLFRELLVALALASLVAVAASAVRAEDTLAAIKARGVLKWGADAEGGAPFVFPIRKRPRSSSASRRSWPGRSRRSSA